jgi:hypothetical protein
VAKPQLQLLQEPPKAQEPELVDSPPVAAENRGSHAEQGVGNGHYLVMVAAVSGPLLVLLGPLLLIVAAKARRRRRRRAAPSPVARMSGGWREVADAAVDLRVLTTPGATRRETAGELAGRTSSVRAFVVGEQVDAAVFGAGEPTDEHVAALWTEIDSLISELRGSAGAWRRLRARFSARSLGLGQWWSNRTGRRRRLRREERS